MFPLTGKKGKDKNKDDERSNLQIADLLPLRQLPKGPKLAQVLKLFRGESAENIVHAMSDFVRIETNADEVQILRMYGEDDFEVASKQSVQKFIYSNKKMPGMLEAVSRRMPLLLEKGNTALWKGIFREQPDFLFLIPVTVTTGKTSYYVIGTAAIAYYSPLPTLLELEKTWHTLLDYLQLTVPLLINVIKYEESEAKRLRLVNALQALTRCEIDIHDVGNCVRTVAAELSLLLNVPYVQVMAVQQDITEEKKLQKYCGIGNPKIDKDRCPNPYCHTNDEYKIAPDSCIGYAVANAKNLRANSPAELAAYGINAKNIHSIGGCIVSNILCIPVAEQSGETPLILELSDKPGGFTYQDEEQAQLFVKRAAAIISSAILLDYKKKSIRRHGIRNEVLANIGDVSHVKVKQLLDLKFQYSKAFKRKLQDFRFSMRLLPDHQSPGVILHIFMDLGMVRRWNMRKSTLIRFILSMQQGYRDIPYHNWKHACCVVHFAYLLLKKHELVKLGYITDLEALTLIISCLAHDIDHRGRNNHFNLCTKSELYRLYKQEDSIMERHHIAVALSVINTEDCNVVQNLTDEEYREFLDLIRWNILSTDLAKYMQNRSDYFYTLRNFDPLEKMHRKHLCAVIMTASDLCDNVKTWNSNLPCVKSIFQEFFAQGDDEIALGLKPMPTMDRRVAYIPQLEIQFLHNIVRPVYKALADLLPQTIACLVTLDYFEDLWLVATSVFDNNSALGDPLLILDLKEMKEESLRRKSSPQLQRILAEHGIPALSIGKIAIKTQSYESVAEAKSVTPARDPTSRRKSSITLHPPPRHRSHTHFGCREFIKNWLCCYICRNRGLMAARAVRKLHLESEYLDKMATSHEKRQSADSSKAPTEGP